MLVIVASFMLAGVQRFALHSPDVAAVVATTLVDLANIDRTENGLSRLSVSPILVRAAQAKANDMATKGYFSHTSPDGLDSWHWFKEAGYVYEHAGENLAIDFIDSADVEQAWMNSITHRDNILNSHYDEIGIATAQGDYEGRPTMFVVQMFATPAFAATSMDNDAAVGASAGVGTVDGVVMQDAARSLDAESNDTQVLGARTGEVSQEISSGNGAAFSLWAYVVSFPHQTLRRIYIVIGLIVLIALTVETGLEFRWHHRHRALRASILLATMTGFFVAAELVFFVDPVLALIGG